MDIKLDIIKEWKCRVHRNQYAHYTAAAYYEKLNQRLGIPVIILSTIVGTTIFATLSKATEESTNVWLIGFIGALSVSAAVLSSLQTFLKHSERAEKHRSSGARYAVLKNKIEKILIMEPDEENKIKIFLDEITIEWDSLVKEAPILPQKIWDKANKEHVITKGG